MNSAASSVERPENELGMRKFSISESKKDFELVTLLLSLRSSLKTSYLAAPQLLQGLLVAGARGGDEDADVGAD